LLFVRNVLVMKNQDRIAIHARLDGRHFVRRQGLAHVNADNLADKDRM